MTKTTQCPACQTRFKVSDAQLSVAQGLVRCGRCAHVFNAIDHLLAPAGAEAPAPAPVTPPPSAPEPKAPAAAVADIDDFELEVPDFDPMAVSLPEAPQEEPVDSGAPSMADVEAFQQALNEALHQQPSSNAPVGGPFAEESARDAMVRPIDEDDLPAVLETRRTPRFEEATEEDEAPAPLPESTRIDENKPAFDPAPTEVAARPRQRPLTTVLVLLGSLIGLLLLAGQLIYVNRTQIAAQAPDTRPAFERLCKKFGCTVPYPTDQEYIRTEWSELSFVPEHTNLVQLSATLKNHAAYPQAFPMLEVTLKDADNQVLIRKVFTPQDYLKPESQKLKRFEANSEEKIVMRFDVGKVHAQGYSLYWFYP
ncbi:DUF3426 domain-containing protein [Paludibacterium sp.]|uniref:DUF3426 domain-containing protein n=1 Tax=Paludibacterium sp. TaxID=1917523 RepID=UPI0025EAA768|nr:DUF3426 domain-containing protein [Paludibacterium sp.]MBV8645877.1 DUF3426 domain-containing protein [Paludibacterium sp.]